MSTDRWWRCQPIHENSLRFSIWSIWYQPQPICVICVMSKRVSMCVSWQVPCNKRKSLGDEVRKKKSCTGIVNCWLVHNWYQYLENGSTIHCQCRTNTLMTNCRLSCWPMVKHHSANISIQLWLVSRLSRFFKKLSSGFKLPWNLSVWTKLQTKMVMTATEYRLIKFFFLSIVPLSALSMWCACLLGSWGTWGTGMLLIQRCFLTHYRYDWKR